MTDWPNKSVPLWDQLWPGAEIWVDENEEEVFVTEEQAVLDEAGELISGERAADYGPAEENFQTIANLWQDYLYTAVGVESVISAQDVAHLLILMKIARQANGHKRDNLVDIAGYAALSQRIKKANDASFESTGL